MTTIAVDHVTPIPQDGPSMHMLINQISFSKKLTQLKANL